MLLVQSSPTEIRQLNIDNLRLELKSLEDDEVGMTFPATHSHNPPVTVGGVSLARVVEIINNYTFTFEDGPYAVNLVGANSNIGDVVNVNQVSVRSANSAGLTFSEDINNQSFLNGSVYIDTVNGQPGTQFPRGTPSDPVDNFQDASSIAMTRNFNAYVISGNLIFSPTDFTTNHKYLGFSPILASATLSGSDISGSSFEKMAISGQANGFSAFQDCRIVNLTDFGGTARDCLLQGNIVVDAGSSGPIILAGCASGVPGTEKPMFDLNSANADFQIRDYTGGIKISNFNQGNSASIDMNVGSVEIDASCTAGVVVVRGVAGLVDNSGPGCTVITDNLISGGGVSGGFTPDDRTRLNRIEATTDVINNNNGPCAA